MRVILCLAGVMVMCFALQANALAHEFIVKPDEGTTLQKNGVYSGQCQAAHIFMISEEAEPLEDVQLTILGSANSVQVQAPTGKPWLQYSFTHQGTQPFVLLGWRKPQIWSQTTTGILAGTKEALEKQGKTVVSVGKYEKFSKTYYGVQPHYQGFMQPAGQRFEIVPVSDIGLVKAGGVLQCKVLLDGKEIPIAVQATYDGYSSEGDVYLQSVQPSADGTVRISLPQKGLWMLRAETTLTKPEPGVDTHNLKATLVFAVE